MIFALREWWEMDLPALQARLRRNAQVIADAVDGLPFLSTKINTWSEGPGCYINISVDEAGLGKTLQQAQAELAAKDPGILTNAFEGQFWVNLFQIKDSEIDYVAQSFRDVLSR